MASIKISQYNKEQLTRVSQHLHLSISGTVSYLYNTAVYAPTYNDIPYICYEPITSITIHGTVYAALDTVDANSIKAKFNKRIMELQVTIPIRAINKPLRGVHRVAITTTSHERLKEISCELCMSLKDSLSYLINLHYDEPPQHIFTNATSYKQVTLSEYNHQQVSNQDFAIIDVLNTLIMSYREFK